MWLKFPSGPQQVFSASRGQLSFHCIWSSLIRCSHLIVIDHTSLQHLSPSFSSFLIDLSNYMYWSIAISFFVGARLFLSPSFHESCQCLFYHSGFCHVTYAAFSFLLLSFFFCLPDFRPHCPISFLKVRKPVYNFYVLSIQTKVKKPVYNFYVPPTQSFFFFFFVQIFNQYAQALFACKALIY